jgi:acyl-CoA reductase-like NAD-dependent aldehyde dehydrogenase
MRHGELYLAGGFVGGPCDSSVAKGPVVSPWSGRTVGSAAEGDWSHMDAALSAAQEAQPAWQACPRFERARLLRGVASLAREHAEELVQTAVEEIGKPVSSARAEVARLAVTFDLAADLLTFPSGEQLPTDVDSRGTGGMSLVERFPVGVVLAIAPYNWPYNLAAHKVAPALAAGNTVVLKPSPLAALCSSALARLLHAAGVPPGAFNLVSCGPDVAERAATDSRVAAVSFTGSEGVGFRLRSIVVDKPVLLELGGDASVIVMADADLAHAARRTALSAFAYAGQVCISAQHALVQQEAFEPFVAELARAAEECATGDPALETTVCGPLIHAEAADRVVSWIDEAKAAGAAVHAGGPRTGNLVSPTVLSGVAPGCRLASEEAFGPVLDVAPFQSLEEAVGRVNSSRYGLNAGLFTTQYAPVLSAFRALQVGTLVVGDAPSLRLDNLPYGGVKRSGYGREGVRSAYEELTQARTLLFAPPHMR